MRSIKDIQTRLNELGYGPVAVDGILGPQTEKSLLRFKKSNDLPTTLNIGPLTLRALFNDSTPVYGVLPWIQEMNKHMGLHERTNNAELQKWLASDGLTLGDPSKYPWCGDAIETSLKLSLPAEVFKGDLKINPYWARNWVQFGVESPPKYGCVGVFKRGTGGHVAFLVGYDPVRKLFRVRGGNQSNRVSDTWIDENRLAKHGIRKPATWMLDLPPLPMMNSTGQIISRDEA